MIITKIYPGESAQDIENIGAREKGLGGQGEEQAHQGQNDEHAELLCQKKAAPLRFGAFYQCLGVNGHILPFSLL
jgi:hypothetical protein